MLFFSKLQEPWEVDGSMAWKREEWASRGIAAATFGIQFGENYYPGYPDYLYLDAKMFFRYGEHRFLSDFLSANDVIDWQPCYPVFISAPTGSGKSTFILDHLLRRIMNHGSDVWPKPKILLLSNRIALNRQLKLAVAERIKWYITTNEQKALLEKMLEADPEEFDLFVFDFTFITVSSYHRLHKDVSDLQQYSIIVFDEFHFFTSDAAFNDYTERIMKKIIAGGQKAVRLYLSATPEVSFEPVLREEIKCFSDRYAQKTRCLLGLFYYHLKRDFSQISEIYTYRSEAELLEAIRHFDGKWCGFVETCNAGNDYQKEVSQERECTFISSKNKQQGKSKKVFETLVNREMLATDVLFCTAVLDNGVNISDPAVKNVAIEVFDRTEFLQMLGRVRRKEGSTLRLFIRKPDEKRLGDYLQSAMADLAEKQLARLGKDDNVKEISLNGMIYSCIHRECNANRVYQRIDTIHRLRRVLRTVEKNHGNSDEKHFSFNAQYAALYRHYSRDEVDIVDDPLRLDMLQIFTPPDPFDGKFFYGLSGRIPLFLTSIIGQLIPVAIGYDTPTAKWYRSLADDSLYTTAIDEMLRWIGKSRADCKVVDFLPLKVESTYENFYQRFVVSLDELRSNAGTSCEVRDGIPETAEEEFLKEYGLLKDSPEYQKFVDYYMNGKKLRGSNTLVYIRGAGVYRAVSVSTRNRKRNTYYLLIDSSELENCVGGAADRN